MKHILKEWKIFLKEVEIANERFDKNVEIIRKAYKDSFYGSGPATIALIDTFTPDNAKILTQVDLEDANKVMAGAYSKVFPIKGSEMLLKLFTQGEKVENDIARMKKIADQIF